MYQNNEITINERAAILLHVVEGVRNWEQLYLVAKGPKSTAKLTEDSKNTLIYRWKNRPEIKKAIQEITKYYNDKKKEIEVNVFNRGSLGETETTKGKKSKNTNETTNFLDRDEFLQFLNIRANQITDDKLRNDILKMLSDNLRYKDSERDENSDIQRFYTPITCENCAIYQRCKGCQGCEM